MLTSTSLFRNKVAPRSDIDICPRNCVLIIFCIFFLFRYGKIQSVKLVSQKDVERPSATVAFMDIKSASKAHNTVNKLDGVPVLTEYSEPTATGSTVTITRTHDPEGATSRGVYTQNLPSKTLPGRYPARADG